MRIIGGRWRGRRLTSLQGDGVRPTSDRVREAWMSSMGGRFEGVRVLDLFAGSGALGLECLSRGAAHVVFVERSPASLDILQQNLDLVGAEPGRVEIVREDVMSWLDTEASPDAGLALADPPYTGGWGQRLADRFTADPFAEELWLEHRSGDRIRSPLLARSRRYGGTTLSTLVRPS